MSALLEGNPEYQIIKVIKVNWGDHKKDAITSELGIRRKSTLVMFNEGKEVNRVIAATSSESIEALFIKALAS